MLVTLVSEVILSDEMAFTGTWAVRIVYCCCRLQEKKKITKIVFESSSAVVKRCQRTVSVTVEKKGWKIILMSVNLHSGLIFGSSSVERCGYLRI